MSPNSFRLIPANGFIWNQSEFTEFLIANQGLPILVTTNNEGVCLESAGVYQQLEQFGFETVTIHTANMLERHHKYQIKFKGPFKFFDITHSDYQHLHTWNSQYRFACFYNRPLWHRIALAAELQQQYGAMSMVNLRADPNDLDQRQLFEIQRLFEFAPQSIDKFVSAMTCWPQQVESIDTYTIGNNTTGHTDQLAQYYPNFLIDIVGETWTQGNAFYPTEKTIRPILLKKPMIVMAGRDYLEYLRQLGFQTFNHFWNEDYDGYENAERYAKILELIHDLSQRSNDEMLDMYTEMQYVLDHNYNLLISHQYSKVITPL